MSFKEFLSATCTPDEVERHIRDQEKYGRRLWRQRCTRKMSRLRNPPTNEKCWFVPYSHFIGMPSLVQIYGEVNGKIKVNRHGLVPMHALFADYGDALAAAEQELWRSLYRIEAMRKIYEKASKDRKGGTK